jgi:replicative DNA helicase
MNNIEKDSDSYCYINKISEDYCKKYQERLRIVDDMYSIKDIDCYLNSIQENFNASYVLIDYVNIINVENSIELNKHVTISTWMKLLAKTRNIHIQAICQANRATKDNDAGYARSENLADSDQYGRDAFTVYSIKTNHKDNIYSINPTKNRNGKSEEEIKLWWNRTSGSIYQNSKDKQLNNIKNKF